MIQPACRGAWEREIQTLIAEAEYGLSLYVRRLQEATESLRQQELKLRALKLLRDQGP